MKKAELDKITTDRIYYELRHNGETFFTVYDTQETIKAFCEMVNGYGINPAEIETITIINGQEQ